MATTHQHLYGSCACERNQYAIAIPHSLITQQQPSSSTTAPAHVFFDNSRANRLTQAAPLTAWLRIPLAWYHSHTRAFYPDESHASIRRTFYTPSSSSMTATAAGRDSQSSNNNTTTKKVRKQFCGYCGTHLNAWREDDDDEERSGGQWMDVTLGSLWGESLGVLGELGWLDDSSSGSDEEEEVEVREGAGAVDRGVLSRRQNAAASMSNRGLPFFEAMMEDGRLGRIKRWRQGAVVGADGRTVEWDFVELDEEDALMDAGVEAGGGGAAAAEGGNGNKRLKLED